MNCSICNKKLEETFLQKLVGTYIRNKSGKKKPVCNECQKKLTVEQIKEKI